MVSNIYNPLSTKTYGWTDNKFVANIDTYRAYRHIDGKSQIGWRSGIKHDCSKVMELTPKNSGFTNKLEKDVAIEPNLVFPLLKGSDLKTDVICSTTRYVIVTQHSTTENTLYIQQKYPRTYQYLSSHIELFNKRASVIYTKRPQFSIFGIGDYSFKHHKIAIGGLYEKTTFSLVMPIDGKPVMLDDTCYLLGFDHIEEAQCIIKILNSLTVQGFLKSIIFTDAKRCINKESLMRIDLHAAAKSLYAEGILTEQEYSLSLRLTKKGSTANLFDNEALPLSNII